MTGTTTPTARPSRSPRRTTATTATTRSGSRRRRSSSAPRCSRQRTTPATGSSSTSTCARAARSRTRSRSSRTCASRVTRHRRRSRTPRAELPTGQQVHALARRALEPEHQRRDLRRAAGSLHCSARSRTTSTSSSRHARWRAGLRPRWLRGPQGRVAKASDNNGNVRETNSEPARYWVDTLAPKRPLIRIDSLHSDEELVNGWHNQHQLPSSRSASPTAATPRRRATCASWTSSSTATPRRAPRAISDSATPAPAPRPIRSRRRPTARTCSRRAHSTPPATSPRRSPTTSGPCCGSTRTRRRRICSSRRGSRRGRRLLLTPPFIAFAGTDAPGGSGIDPAKDPSGSSTRSTAARRATTWRSPWRKAATSAL